MIIGVFSLGQFVSSKLDVLKLGFENWFKTQHKEVLGEDVWQWMANNLAPLRLGNITVKQFCDQFNQYFDVNISFTEFNKIFNSMCELDKSSLERVTKFKNFLNSHDDVQFVLVSHTNYSHLNYILSQLQAILPVQQSLIISDEQEWLENEKILFAPSMSSKCTEHSDTLKYAVNKLKLEEKDLVVSFLNTIKKSEHPNFTYIDPGKDLEKVMEIIENLVTQKELNYSV
ncbi:Uncharacterised protein [Legionella busanensis]|uniref:Uncharacterized protein n=1 Tax=Legionella busanensis TaxID=190655 RepID=A0A378JUZ1_9GAMM|nr:hypothetical protein [Legionella busanensis]STX52032.1 Uncharacterised protein [Legionella busanensis]